MNPNDNNDYNPAKDDNQGILTNLAQGEESNNGVSQIEYMNPVFNQGPEPVKEEVNGVNDDMLAEEDVADGNIVVDNE